MNKLMAKLIVGTETVFFLALIVAFMYFTYNPTFHADSKTTLDIKTTAVFSLFLFFSSFTLWRAETSQRNGKIKNLKYWLLATIVLGVIFLIGQGSEYYRLLKQGFNISKSVFSTSFFTLTGFHGLHVFIGLLVLSIVLVQFFRKSFDVYRNNILGAVGIYWHFVDIVWLFVFTVVYVLPYF